MRQPWKTDWKILKEKEPGGQGHIYLVENKSTGKKAILKKLIKQDDPDRRRRMHREVTALKTLQHRGIPDLLDTNTHKYKSDAILYFVQEHIEGPTLGEKVQKNILSVDEAIRLLYSLLEILEYTHQEGERHRDIKPDNIILRNDDENDPVLIDFGLTFNQKTSSYHVTPENQQLGNRFLALPELQISSSNQRDPRSDLTQCMGILLYSLTGIIPVTLFNEKEELPHQRKDVRQKLEEVIDRDSLKNYLSLFDRGFTLKIDHRWQSAREIINQISQISRENINDEIKSEISLREIDNHIKANIDYDQRKMINEIWHSTYPIIRQTTHEIIDELGTNYTQMGKGLGINWEELSFAEEQGIKNTLYGDFKFKIRFIGRITGNEVILISLFENKTEEVCRLPLSNNIDWSYVEMEIKTHYSKKFKTYSENYLRQ